MREFEGRTFRVERILGMPGAYVYKLTDATGYGAGWSFLPEWLRAAEVGTTSESLEPDQVLDFSGTLRNASMCIELTYPSEHAGKLAHMAIVTRGVFDGGARFVVLDREFNSLIVEIERKFFVKADVSEDDYVYCDGGSREGEHVWLENATYVADISSFMYEGDHDEYFFYHDGPGEYFSYPPEAGTFAYHAQADRGYIRRTSSDTRYTIGFEVEKEDSNILDSYTADDALSVGWSREHDGSLDDDTGYELVSPIYDLFDDRLENEVAASKLLRDHINAESSGRCGGHINFGKVGTSGTQLLKECSAFLPLFIALYRRRVLSRWASMRVDINEYNGDDRYVAFNVKREYIEFRLISRVNNVDTLVWRRDLFRIMASNPNIGAAKVQQMMLDRRSALHKHLRKMYTEEKLLRLACWYSQFADAMFDTLQFSKTGHGVMMDFFVSSLRKSGKRIGVSIDSVEGWVQDVYDILSRARGGDKYVNSVKKVDRNTLKFLQVKG